ncbi:hypothetical protein F66182_765 [Fusarium sp. NRRL 66182]|nr:hypothetical protein F66182_765 [Fusarium sp. NRRL 66182]
MASANGLPQAMRAAQWRSVKGGIDKNLKIATDAKLPKTAHSLPKGQTLVKVAYASLNHLDYKVAEMPLGSLLFHKPATPGLDFSGTVVSSTLSNFHAGQRVFGRTQVPAEGTLAEYVVVGEEGIAALPDGVALRDAACIGICGITALQCLMPFVKPGDEVLINGGSGGAGMFAIQVAKALGCSRVTTTCSASNVEFCRNLGADNVIAYDEEDPVQTLKQRGALFDHVLDTVFANPDLYWQSHHYLKPHGTFVCIGLPQGFKTFKSLMTISLLPKWMGGGKRRFKYHSVTANREHFAQVASWIQAKKVQVVIEKEYGLEDAVTAYANLKGGKVRGKLLVHVGDASNGLM